MAWSFVAIGAIGTGNGTKATAVLPTGHTSGDLLIIHGASNATFSTPAGWTAAVLNGSATNRGSVSVWYKIDGGSETNVDVTTASSTAQVVMLAYRNINGTPLDVLGTATTTNTTSSSTTSLTTTTANDLVVSFWSMNPLTVTGITAPGSVNLRLQSDPTSSLNGLMIVDENQTIAGATTSRSWTGASVNVGTGNMAVSFKQTAGGSTPSGASFLFLMI